MKKRSLLLVMSVLLVLSLGCSLVSTPGDVEAPPAEMPEAESAVDAPEASSQESEASGANANIPAADAPAKANCELLDIASFNAIAGEEFTFKTQDQLGSCYYQSENYMLTIGGGEAIDAASAEELFMSILGKLPGAEWKSYPAGFMLGTAAASTGITAQGVSTSGHALAIMVVGHPDAPKESVMQLAVEAARQLNAQWAQ